MKGRQICIHLTNIYLQREQHWKSWPVPCLSHYMSNLRCWVWSGRQCWFGWQRVNLIPASYYTRIVCIVRALCVLYARACYDSTLQRAAL